jgi:hypothetical protein
MKRFVGNIFVIIIIMIIGLTGCGDGLISDLKDFVPNEPPEITSFTTDIVAGTEILPNMEVNLTVEAHDDDNDEIQYGFSSGNGTFRKLTSTAAGCTIQFFISSTCPTSQSIPITVTASDPRNGSMSMTIDIGDGRAAPSITNVSWPGSIIAGGSSISFTPDCSGYYQVRTAASGTTSLAFDGTNYPCLACDINTPVSITVYSGSGSGANYLNLGTAGTYSIFIILYDNFKRQSEVYQELVISL